MVPNKNKLIIAAAGSGKTTYLVDKALEVSDKNVLITTYTDANRDEIINKIFLKKKCIPKNITVQTWFSFLLQHGVRPYQGLMNSSLFDKKIGFYLVEGRSGLKCYFKGHPIYFGESDFKNYYFTDKYKIYSDKISKFISVCNIIAKEEIIKRIERIYHCVFIDEVQDLSGWDLEIIKLFLTSKSSILMVGDPRQTTYSTNESTKYEKYKDGKIKEFIETECPKGICEFDTSTLNRSHRNNKAICDFSSMLYPNYPKCEPCECSECRKNNIKNQGIFLVEEKNVERYCDEFGPLVKLHFQKSIFPDLNYGASKGLGFDRVLIYPTEKISQYIKDGDLSKIESIKAKLYVASTRARYSVGIVCKDNFSNFINGVQKYIPSDTKE